MLRPLAPDNPAAVFDMRLDRRVHTQRVDETGLEEVPEVQLRRQHHLEIVGLVQGVFVVLGVAGPEVHVATPAEEAVQAQKKPVEPSGPKDRIVAQLVRGVEQEDGGKPLAQ